MLPNNAKKTDGGKSSPFDWVNDLTTEEADLPLLTGSHVAIIYNETHVLLISERPGKLFNLPGGHSLPGESPNDTLWRELAEELGCTVPATFACRSSQVTSTNHVVSSLYICRVKRLPAIAPSTLATFKLASLFEPLPSDVTEYTVRHLSDLARSGCLFADIKSSCESSRRHDEEKAKAHGKEMHAQEGNTMRASVRSRIYVNNVVRVRCAGEDVFCCGLCDTCTTRQQTPDERAYVVSPDYVLVKCKGPDSAFILESGNVYHRKAPIVWTLTQANGNDVMVRVVSRAGNARRKVEQKANNKKVHTLVGNTTFRHGGEQFAAAAGKIMQFSRCSDVPDVPDAFEGLICAFKNSGILAKRAYAPFVHHATAAWGGVVNEHLLTLDIGGKEEERDAKEVRQKRPEQPSGAAAPAKKHSRGEKKQRDLDALASRIAKRYKNDAEGLWSWVMYSGQPAKMVEAVLSEVEIEAPRDPQKLLSNVVHLTSIWESTEGSGDVATLGALVEVSMGHATAALWGEAQLLSTSGSAPYDSSNPDKVTAYLTKVTESMVDQHAAVLAEKHNSLMHALNGNTANYVPDVKGMLTDYVSSIVNANSLEERVDAALKPVLRGNIVGRLVVSAPEFIQDAAAFVRDPSWAGLATVVKDVATTASPVVEEAASKAVGAAKAVGLLPNTPTDVFIPGNGLPPHTTGDDADGTETRPMANVSGLAGALGQTAQQEYARLVGAPEQAGKQAERGGYSLPTDPTLAQLRAGMAGKPESDAVERAIATILKAAGAVYTGPALTGGVVAADTPEEFKRAIAVAPNSAMERVTRQHDIDYAMARTQDDLDRADLRAIEQLVRLGPTAKLAALALQANMQKRSLTGKSNNLPRETERDANNSKTRAYNGNILSAPRVPTWFWSVVGKTSAVRGPRSSDRKLRNKRKHAESGNTDSTATPQVLPSDTQVAPPAAAAVTALDNALKIELQSGAIVPGNLRSRLKPIRQQVSNTTGTTALSTVTGHFMAPRTFWDTNDNGTVAPINVEDRRVMITPQLAFGSLDVGDAARQRYTLTTLAQELNLKDSSALAAYTAVRADNAATAVGTLTIGANQAVSEVIAFSGADTMFHVKLITMMLSTMPTPGVYPAGVARHCVDLEMLNGAARPDQPAGGGGARYFFPGNGDIPLAPANFPVIEAAYVTPSDYEQIRTGVKEGPPGWEYNEWGRSVLLVPIWDRSNAKSNTLNAAATLNPLVRMGVDTVPFYQDPANGAWTAHNANDNPIGGQPRVAGAGGSTGFLQVQRLYGIDNNNATRLLFLLADNIGNGVPAAGLSLFDPAVAGNLVPMGQAARLLDGGFASVDVTGPMLSVYENAVSYTRRDYERACYNRQRVFASAAGWQNAEMIVAAFIGAWSELPRVSFNNVGALGKVTPGATGRPYDAQLVDLTQTVNRFNLDNTVGRYDVFGVPLSQLGGKPTYEVDGIPTDMQYALATRIVAPVDAPPPTLPLWGSDFEVKLMMINIGLADIYDNAASAARFNMQALSPQLTDEWSKFLGATNARINGIASKLGKYFVLQNIENRLYGQAWNPANPPVWHQASWRICKRVPWTDLVSAGYDAAAPEWALYTEQNADWVLGGEFQSTLFPFVAPGGVLRTVMTRYWDESPKAMPNALRQFLVARPRTTFANHYLSFIDDNGTNIGGDVSTALLPQACFWLGAVFGLTVLTTPLNWVAEDVPIPVPQPLLRYDPVLTVDVVVRPFFPAPYTGLTNMQSGPVLLCHAVTTTRTLPSQAPLVDRKAARTRQLLDAAGMTGNGVI